jgi:RNA polymerase sigma-70 factor (ECF subfamily)
MVIAWRRGGISAFEELVRKYQKRMFNIAYLCVGDYEDACEVTRDAFVTAYRGKETFRGAIRFSAWITCITIRLSRSRLRKSRTGRSDRSVSSDLQMAGGHGEVARKVPASAPEQLERLDLSGKLHGCIGALDADSREMIVLRDVQGFSFVEICSILSIREGTVKSRLSRARELVKDCLKRAEGTL